MMKWMLQVFMILPRAASAGELIAQVSDGAGKPVADAVVFLYEAPGGPFEPSETPVVIDQIDKQFTPYVTVALVGSKVSFPNKDNIHHHIYSFSKAKKFELPIYKDEKPDPIVLDKVGVVKLSCNIHDWMLGYILIVDNPYFAKTGADGRAHLTGLPAGSHKVGVWSDRLKGAVEETIQKAAIGGETVRLQFKPKLSPARKTTRPALSNY